MLSSIMDFTNSPNNKSVHEHKTEHKEYNIDKPKWKFNYPATFEKHYKKLLFIPLIIFILALAVIGFKYFSGQELIKKDVSLTGGVTLTAFTSEEIDIADFRAELGKSFSDISVRTLRGLESGKQVGIVVEMDPT